MARREPFLPYQQGDLDGLCGIYAIINALRLALRVTAANRLGDEDWGELFHVLLGGADRTIGAVTIAAAGIEPKPLAKLLKLAAQHMAYQHEIALTVSRPLKAAKGARFQDAVGQLAAISNEPGSALMICLSGHLDHWTVVRKVANTTLELFDSDGLTRVKLANCRLSREQPASPGREHVIRLRGVFRLSIAEAD